MTLFSILNRLSKMKLNTSVRSDMYTVFIYKRLLVLVLFCSPLISLFAQSNHSISPLDLRKTDFNQKQTATLNTTWAFYPQVFIAPDQIQEAKGGVPIVIPSTWGGTPYQDSALADQGYGTYHLQVQLPNYQQDIGLKVPEMSTSYIIYVNGKQVAKVGEIGTSVEQSIPETKPLVIYLGQIGQKADIVIHISNFHHKKGGLWDTIHIGTYRDMVSLERKSYFYAIFLFGAILIIGLYHIGIFLLTLQQKAPLYFSLFAISTVFRIISTGEMFILDIWPSLSWEWRLSFDHISMYCSLGFGTLFMNSLFPQDFKGIPFKLIVSLSFLFTLIALVTPGIFNSYIVIYFQLIIVVSISYMMYPLILAAKRNRDGAIPYLIGALIIFIGTTNDVLYALNIIATWYIMPFCVFSFFFSQAFVLALRSAKAFTKVEKLSTKLTQVNQELEQKVEERTATIVSKNNDLEKTNAALHIREVALEKQAEVLKHTNTDLQQAQTAMSLAIEKEKSINKELANTLHQLQEAQSQLIQSEKMASLGQLTAGIAHEINNPINFVSVGVECVDDLIKDLMSILLKYEQLDQAELSEMSALLANIESLKQDMEYHELKADITQSLKDVKTGVSRTIDIVNGLRDFARGDTGTTASPADIHQCLHSCLLILKNNYKHRIQIELAFDAESSVVICRIGQIHQVFLNLISNAIQAIEGEGSIHISTQLHTANTFLIQIQDSGTGISPDTLQKIFDPFFTTKEVGKGTGLGLSITHGIVTAHDGHIEVDSEPGKGTSFSIYLPIDGPQEVAS